MTDIAPETRTLVMERQMPHPPEKVWRALTQAPLLEDWLMKTDFEPVVGRAFSFRMAPTPHWDGVVEGEVLTVEPMKRLAYTWTSPSAGQGLKSVVTWILTPTPGGVMVRMEQSGFGPDSENAYRGATFGWTRNLANLEQVAARLD